MLIIAAAIGLYFYFQKKTPEKTPEKTQETTPETTPETTKTTESEKPKNDNIATMDLAPGIATMDLDFSKMNLDFSNMNLDFSNFRF